MLAPSADVVRRPSSTSDLILSRTDSQLVANSKCAKSPGDPRDRYQHAYLSPSGSVHSAPLSASSSACWTGAAAAAGGSPEYSWSSTPSASPEARKRYWCRRLMKLKEEMDRFGDGVRRNLRGSIDSLATRLSPSMRRRCRNGDGVERLCGNGLSVDIVREVRRQRSRSADRSRSAVKLDEETGRCGNDDAGRSYDYKLPSTLMLTELRDGAFFGEVVLDSASPAQLITIRIRDYRLEFYVPVEDASAERPSPPHFIGAVSLPIYVDPGSILFQLSSSESAYGGMHRLLVEGRMKGCGAGISEVGPRRLCASASDLRPPKSPVSESHHQKRPVWIIGDGCPTIDDQQSTPT